MMYKAVKTLNREKLEKLEVQDETGTVAATPNEILEITTKLFKSNSGKNKLKTSSHSRTTQTPAKRDNT